MPSMDLSQLESIHDYVDFDSDSVRAVREFLPRARPHLRRVVDDFYDTIEAHPEASRVITGGPAQVERLKATLVDWLESLLSGHYDAEYLARHARIGRVHVRIGLPQHLMFTAMSRVRGQLLALVDSEYEPGDEKSLLSRSLNQLLDVELSIMLDSFREDLVEKQRSSERLATIGELAASVAHELRNPLGTMESSLFLMKRRLEKMAVEDAVLEKHHDKALRQVQHCNDTITRLLDLARDRPPRLEQLPLSETLENIVRAMGLPDNTRVSFEDRVDSLVWVDRTQLGLVIMNLIRNAAEAAPGGVNVRIGAGVERGGVFITVSDDGPGIPEEVRPRVFEALFTTRAQGTGLGLALVGRIVDAHGGEISLNSTNKGASFKIWLPGVPNK